MVVVRVGRWPVCFAEGSYDGAAAGRVQDRPAAWLVGGSFIARDVTIGVHLDRGSGCPLTDEYSVDVESGAQGQDGLGSGLMCGLRRLADQDDRGEGLFGGVILAQRFDVVDGVLVQYPGAVQEPFFEQVEGLVKIVGDVQAGPGCQVGDV